ncbi:hypothetical protein PGH47_34740 [Streptomyces sp. HUAS 31]|nr:hypothetical protein [Streptomyces sp. HUAS 31]WCE00557.1 hypothetical protein PGH47_34740 [Streptomyces sp. HUAS 31]
MRSFVRGDEPPALPDEPMLPLKVALLGLDGWPDTRHRAAPRPGRLFRAR